VTIVDADIALVINGGGHNSASKVTLKAHWRNGAATDGEMGHYGFGTHRLTQDNLIEDCSLETTFVHNLSVANFASGNVFSRITTKTGRFDHHARRAV
jgi:hypothetical protein